MDIPSIQMVILYKWAVYTKGFFMNRFLLHILFILSFLTELMICQNQLHEATCTKVSQGVGMFVMLYFLFYEVRQFLMQRRFADYFKNYWNISDILLLAVYATYLFIPGTERLTFYFKTI